MNVPSRVIVSFPIPFPSLSRLRKSKVRGSVKVADWLCYPAFPLSEAQVTQVNSPNNLGEKSLTDSET